MDSILWTIEELDKILVEQEQAKASNDWFTVWLCENALRGHAGCIKKILSSLN